ncbi:sensor histidine kinase [Niallia sp.]|uniref:cache domain-containing sensor histidine kinase n=1 Tax=Niallia sp. TaxID=2837523 RepID=UPI0028996174|nr:sensor histidine kinase [Niallia sp.]
MIFKRTHLFKLGQAPLKRKLIITYMIMTVIPLGILGYITYAQNTKAIEEQVGEYIPRLLNQANKNIENELTLLNDLPNAVYNSKEIMSILRSTPYKEKSAFLQEQYTVESFLANNYLNSNQSDILAAFLITNNGNYISTKTSFKGMNFDDAILPFGEIHDLAGETPIILPNKTKIAFEKDTPFILLVNELTDFENRESLGSLIFAVDVTFIEKILNDIDKEGRATMWLMDENGYIIYHPDKMRIGQVDEGLAGYPLVNGSFHTTHTKENVLYSMNQSTNKHWILVHSIPMKYLTERTDIVKNYTLSIFLILTIVSTMISIFIAWTVTKPIKQLGKVMKEVEEGNLHVTISPTNKDEVGQLAESFQSMLEQLRILIRKNYEVELQQRNAQIYALQSQINPHFMYNTLETIGAVIEEEDSETAVDMVEILGQMLRYSLSSSENLVLLQTELTHIKNYLKLQKIRFEDRVNYEIVGENHLPIYYSPKFILQPIIENIFKYGMKQRKVLIISIEISVEDGKLKIVIKDNGPGIDKEMLQKIKKNLNKQDYFTRESGVGLTNVHARIKMLFSDKYGITIESKQSIGTTVTILLPLIQDPYMVFENRLEGGRENGEN